MTLVVDRMGSIPGVGMRVRRLDGRDGIADQCVGMGVGRQACQQRKDDDESGNHHSVSLGLRRVLIVADHWPAAMPEDANGCRAMPSVFGPGRQGLWNNSAAAAFCIYPSGV